MTRLTNSSLFNIKQYFLQQLFTKTTYPWEIIPIIKDYIAELINTGIKGYTLMGKSILIGEGVKIHDSAVIEGPAIIGSHSELRTGAYLRNNVIISEGCVIGNSTEIKNSILLDFAKAPHYNYIGDSIIGNRAHLGAGAICSNLKTDKSNIVIRCGEGIETGLRKLGAIIADDVEIGCGCVMNPGTVVGKGSSAYPLSSLRGVYPAECIIKSGTHFTSRL